MQFSSDEFHHQRGSKDIREQESFGFERIGEITVLQYKGHCSLPYSIVVGHLVSPPFNLI